MAISMEEVKALRDETGISVMECKKALEEAGGDKAKAMILLRKKSSEVAAKKAGRELGAGAIASYVHNTGSVGAMVVLSCETDFVAKNPEFKALAYDIAMHVAALGPAYIRMEDVPPADRDRAASVFQEEVNKMDKPEEIKKKALEGKINAYFKERTLLEQPFVKDPEKTIGDLIHQAVQKFGEKTSVTQITRLSV